MILMLGMLGRVLAAVQRKVHAVLVGASKHAVCTREASAGDGIYLAAN